MGAIGSLFILGVFGAILHLVVSIGSDELPRYKQEMKLKRDLLRDYDANFLPLISPTDNVTVKVKLSLRYIDNLDIQTETLTTFARLSQDWTDVRLKWNELDYNGLRSIRLSISDVWTPDLVLCNSASERNDPTHDTDVILFSSGQVRYMPPSRFRTTCAIDLSYFPYDTQSCTIRFGSWTYSGDVLVLESGGVDLADYVMDATWQLIDVSDHRNVIYYVCCAEPYYDIVFNITLRRRTGLLVNMYISPAVCFALMISTVFLLPAGSNHKLIIGCCLLIVQVLLLNMLAVIVPFSHFTAPRLVLYYMFNIFLTSTALVVSIGNIWLWERANREGPGVPRGVKALFLGFCGRMLCVRPAKYVDDKTALEEVSRTEEAETDDVTIIRKNGRLVAPAEWRQLAVVVDRLMLVLYLAISILIVILLCTV